jgi:hypothetical protein
LGIIIKIKTVYSYTRYDNSTHFGLRHVEALKTLVTTHLGNEPRGRMVGIPVACVVVSELESQPKGQLFWLCVILFRHSMQVPK